MDHETFYTIKKAGTHVTDWSTWVFEVYRDDDLIATVSTQGTVKSWFKGGKPVDMKKLNKSLQRVFKGEDKAIYPVSAILLFDAFGERCAAEHAHNVGYNIKLPGFLIGEPLVTISHGELLALLMESR